MRWSFPIAWFKGTVVRIHVTLLLFLAWIGFSAYQRGGAEAAMGSVLFISAIFACVLLHEFGHILTARRFGIVSPEVTLLPIGGAADMNAMPEKPWQELMIAIAGPAVNVVIAAALFFTADAFNLADAAQIENPSISFAEKLAGANLFLAGFNLIPAFPMDGGRVLRAALATWLGQGRATRIAARIGQGFALLLGFAGILIHHPMLVLIALFVFAAARSEVQMTTMAEAARNHRAGDAMAQDIALIPYDATFAQVNAALVANSQDDFPLVDADGKLYAIFSRAELVDASSAVDPDARIASMARRETPIVSVSSAVAEALPALNEGFAVGVIGADGRFIGLLTRQSVVDIMMIHEAPPDWPFGRTGSRDAVASAD